MICVNRLQSYTIKARIHMKRFKKTEVITPLSLQDNLFAYSSFTLVNNNSVPFMSSIERDESV